MDNNMIETSPEIKARLSSLGIVKVFKKGETILNENTFITVIPIVQKGCIKVMRIDLDGRKILLYYINAGESCVMSIFGGIYNDTSKVKVVAEEETEILFISIDKVSILIKEYPEWVDYLFKLYHKRFEELLDVLDILAFNKLDKRLLNLIQKKCELTKSKTLLVTHDELANDFGRSRVIVSRLLKQMENENLLILGRNKITLM